MALARPGGKLKLQWLAALGALVLAFLVLFLTIHREMTDSPTPWSERPAPHRHRRLRCIPMRVA
jgi:hypothetical protein